MKLVIDIPENEYRHIREYYEKNDIAEATYSYIYHGTPLPKGHGRLIDADALCDYFWDNRSKLYAHKDLRIVVDNAPTIIEADKESEDKE